MDNKLRRLTQDLDIISQLPDQPNDAGGLTAAELKAKFDEAALIIKDFINNVLLNDVEDAIGSGTIDQISGNKLVDLSVGVEKLKSGCVDGSKIANGAVSETKLAASSVGTDNIKGAAVTVAKLSPGFVLPPDKGGTGVKSIDELKSALGTVPVDRGGTGAIDAAGARTALGITLVNLGISYGTEEQRPENPQEGQIFLVKVG